MVRIHARVRLTTSSLRNPVATIHRVHPRGWADTALCKLSLTSRGLRDSPPGLPPAIYGSQFRRSSDHYCTTAASLYEPTWQPALRSDWLQWLEWTTLGK